MESEPTQTGVFDARQEIALDHIVRIQNRTFWGREPLFNEKDGKECTRCHAIKPRSEFYIFRHRDPIGQLCSACKDCSRKRTADYRRRTPEKVKHNSLRYKLECLQAYGDVCGCCGEANPVFLTIDHIDAGGAWHRKTISKTKKIHFYTWLRKNIFPVGFRVLCFNCNCGRNVNGGICPHQESRDNKTTIPAGPLVSSSPVVP